MEGLNIRHFKLMNGEEIIGLVAIKNDDNFIIDSVTVMRLMIIIDTKSPTVASVRKKTCAR